MKINTNDLRVAAVRYFDVAHNGLEFTEPLSFVVLLNRGDTYINILNPGEFAPIYRRVPYTTNILGTDQYFGTKVELIEGEAKDGEAWLLTDTDLHFEFKSDEVYLRDIEDYVIRNSYFYHNRADIIEQRLCREDMPFWLRRSLAGIKEQDSVKQGEMNTFFAERGVQKVMQK